MILYAPPGIGDVYWLLMKILPSTRDSVDIKVASTENQRASFLNYIEGVASVEPGAFSLLKNKKTARMHNYTRTESVMHLEANTHLESGQRIESYLPSLDTSFRLNWKTTRDGFWVAKQYLGKRTIAIHTSSLRHNELNDIGIGQDWGPQKWIEIIRQIYDLNPGVDLVWVGAKYDLEMLYFLQPHFPQMKAMVEENADVVMNFLRNCEAFISYQCGLSVVTICEGIPTYMIYFDWLRRMPNTFCPHTSISNSIYGYGFFDTMELDAPAKWLEEL
jgi:hypothetical protein